VLVCGLILIQTFISILISTVPLEQQLYGRTGRGLGLILVISSLILFLVTIIFIDLKSIHYICIGLIIASVVSSIYTIFQKFGLDVFEWNTRTNGLIGTVGNPNFQSALSCLALPPLLAILINKRRYYSILIYFAIGIVAYCIFICASTQGYLASLFALFTYVLTYLWYKNRNLFSLCSLVASIFLIFTILGMMGKGPLSYYLDKISLRSRFEMWQTALNAISSKPLFGFGLESFGDISPKFKPNNIMTGVNEFADNPHNYYLDYAVSGGVLLALLYLILTFLVLYSFVKSIKRNLEFNPYIAALMSSWIALQAQSIISPRTITLTSWNCFLGAVLIGLNFKIHGSELKLKNANVRSLSNGLSALSLILAITVIFPYWNADHLQLRSEQTRNGNIAIQSATMYPESVVRYSRITIELLTSGLYEQALFVGRSAVEFNPYSSATWLLIVANDKAPLAERIKARQKVLELDPYNIAIKHFTLPEK